MFTFPSSPWPHNRLNKVLTSDGQSVSVLQRITRPHIVVLDNVLSDAECELLKSLASTSMKRALVTADTLGVQGVVDHRRTSELTCVPRFLHPQLTIIEERLSELTGIPSSHGESFQVMRYGVGAEYQPHMDTFDLSIPGQAQHVQRSGQRVATMVIYLNDPEEGGETVFPRCTINVSPGKGRAVHFAYTDENGNPDPLSFHGGSPVVRGEKWIATMWFRQKPHRFF